MTRALLLARDLLAVWAGLRLICNLAMEVLL